MDGSRTMLDRSLFLPLKSSFRDVRTRWDSTFIMLRHFIDMRAVSVSGIFYVIVSHNFDISGNR